MFGKIDNEYGEIIIGEAVIAKLAGMVANMCYGVVGMAVRNTKDGIVSLLKPSNLTKGVKVSVEDNRLYVDLHIVVQYGVNINAISESIMHNVKYQIAKMTDFEVKEVNIFVESIRINHH